MREALRVGKAHGLGYNKAVFCLYFTSYNAYSVYQNKYLKLVVFEAVGIDVIYFYDQLANLLFPLYSFFQKQYPTQSLSILV